jgi:hypothetical protein
MDPYVRYFADRLEGLEAQLLELKGFARTVPPLVQAERNRIWDEAVAQSDEYSEPIYVYDRLSGSDTGGGFAKFDQAVYAAALNLGWDRFVGFLQDELLAYVSLRFYGHDKFELIVSKEERALRDFGSLNGRYIKWFKIDLDATWPSLKEMRELRNAVVHNFGCYTAEYLAVPSHRPPEETAFERSDDELIDHVLIPLDEAHVHVVLDQLGEIASAVRQRVLEVCPERGAHWIIGYRARWLRRPPRNTRGDPA